MKGRAKGRMDGVVAGCRAGTQGAKEIEFKGFTDWKDDKGRWREGLGERRRREGGR